jgi:hypothetical protein
MNQQSFKCGAYHITSHGNGFAYTIERAHQTIWAQGEDAAQIREDSNDFNNSSAIDDYFYTFFSS